MLIAGRFLRASPHLACGRLKSKLIGIQDQNIPVRMKDRDGKFQEHCTTRDIVSVVKWKNEEFVKARRLGARYRQQGTDQMLEEYKKCKKLLRREIRRAKRGHKTSLAAEWRKIPRRFKHL